MNIHLDHCRRWRAIPAPTTSQLHWPALKLPTDPSLPLLSTLVNMAPPSASGPPSSPSTSPSILSGGGGFGSAKKEGRASRVGGPAVQKKTFKMWGKSLGTRRLYPRIGGMASSTTSTARGRMIRSTICSFWGRLTEFLLPSRMLVRPR